MATAGTREELTLEVNRLRFLDKKHREISEQAEADVREAREKAHRIAKELRRTLFSIQDICTNHQQCPLTQKTFELLDALDHL